MERDGGKSPIERPERYGKRWTVEYVFSAIGGLSGEHLSAPKRENKIQEVKIRINPYRRRDDVLAKAERVA